MNFYTSFKQGQEGVNKGLSMGEGLQEVSNAVNGVQRAMIYGVAAAPKVGKSTFVDYTFVIQPYLYSLANNVPLEITYFSFEIDRISKEFDFAAHFLYSDYQIMEVDLPAGVTYKDETKVEMSSNFLRGKLQDDNGKTITVSPEIEEMLKQVYLNRIIPLFGEYDADGTMLSRGIIDFVEQKDNPTGLRNFLLDKAKRHGTFLSTKYTNKHTKKAGERIYGYKANDPNRMHIVVTDHLRKMIPERGFSLKQTVDKYIEYSVELRNWCQDTFIHIIHLNRGMTDMTRIKYSGDLLYPNGDDIKDTGNLSEEADFLFTMLNPNDERYQLKEHFGKKIKDKAGNDLYPKMRTIHLVESRHTDFPQHFRVNMYGGVKSFERLVIEE